MLKGRYWPGDLGQTLGLLVFNKLPGDDEAADPGNTLSNKDLGKRDCTDAGVKTILNSSLFSTNPQPGPQAERPQAFYLINGHNITNLAPRLPSSRIQPSLPHMNILDIGWNTLLSSPSLLDPDSLRSCYCLLCFINLTSLKSEIMLAFQVC